jgi:hypothetical protein
LKEDKGLEKRPGKFEGAIKTNGLAVISTSQVRKTHTIAIAAGKTSKKLPASAKLGLYKLHGKLVLHVPLRFNCMY